MEYVQMDTLLLNIYQPPQQGNAKDDQNCILVTDYDCDFSQCSPVTPGPGRCVQDMQWGMVCSVSSVVTTGLSTLSDAITGLCLNVVTSPRYLTFLTSFTLDNGDGDTGGMRGMRNLQ